MCPDLPVLILTRHSVDVGCGTCLASLHCIDAACKTGSIASIANCGFLLFRTKMHGMAGLVRFLVCVMHSTSNGFRAHACWPILRLHCIVHCSGIQTQKPSHELRNAMLCTVESNSRLSAVRRCNWTAVNKWSAFSEKASFPITFRHTASLAAPQLSVFGSATTTRVLGCLCQRRPY